MADKPQSQALVRLDPQALIAAAIEKGAGIETLERLVALAKDMRQVTAREAWYEAMAEFQRRCPAIKKSKTAQIGDRYSYKYAPLDEILSTIQELMGELGLSVSWRTYVKDRSVVANCWIAHKLGHHEESGDVVMPFEQNARMNPAQVVGSASTYAKRYALLAILGMAPEDDDDAHGTEPVDRAARSNDYNRKPAGDAQPVGADRGVPGRPVPLDPDDPALRTESETLLPFEDERTTLVDELVALWKSMKATRGWVQSVLREHGLNEKLALPDADWSNVDLAELVQLRDDMKAERTRR